MTADPAVRREPASGEAAGGLAGGRAAAGRGGRRVALLAAKVAISGIALWWTLSRVDARALVAHAVATPTTTFVAVIGLLLANLLVGAVRWRVLAVAYGARSRDLPNVLVLFRLYLQGLFYNTFLPGNVGGDVLRAWILGRALGDPAGAGMVVLVERVLGLAGLACVAAVAATVAGIPGVDLRLWGALALVGTLAGVGVLSMVPKLAPRIPGAVGRFASKLPRLVRPGAFSAAVVLSIVTQLLAAYSGHVLLEATAERALPLGRSLAIVPVTVLASYFPFTVAGIGAREAAFVSLASSLGVAADAATAASLLLLGATLVVAIVGGLLSLVPLPRSLAPAPDGPSSRTTSPSDE